MEKLTQFQTRPLAVVACTILMEEKQALPFSKRRISLAVRDKAHKVPPLRFRSLTNSGIDQVDKQATLRSVLSSLPTWTT